MIRNMNLEENSDAGESLGAFQCNICGALFGLDLPLPQFPALRSLRGLGIGDSEVYSAALPSTSATPTRSFIGDPRFDLLRPDGKQFGEYGFVICGDVLEHVPAPIEQALQDLGTC